MAEVSTSSIVGPILSKIIFETGVLYIIEIVFAWPGTGRLVLNAINQRDYPVLMGIYLIMSIAIAVMMMVVDIVYAIVDPRIRY